VTTICDPIGDLLLRASAGAITSSRAIFIRQTVPARNAL
jgi:uncharacterized membrane protein